MSRPGPGIRGMPARLREALGAIARAAAVGTAGLPLLVGAAAPASGSPARAPRITVGSKAFPESWILAEAAARLARTSGATADHRANLGGTEIVYQALRSGSIDLYPEYTGTISEVILKVRGRPALPALRAALAHEGVGVSQPLGFNDGYALGVRRDVAHRYGLVKLSDLGAHPELRLGLSHEFIGRDDGWAGLARRYDLSMPHLTGLQHDLAYGAVASGAIDVMDIYTTDPQIEKLDLVILADDRDFFPRYDAVFLYRLALEREAPDALRAMQSLAGRVHEAQMTRANGLVALHHVSYQDAAARLLDEIQAGATGTPTGAGHAGGRNGAATHSQSGAGGNTGSAAATTPRGILRNVAAHLTLVSISLLAAILLGIPLGVLATRSRPVAAITLSAAGLLQTIPSLALLAFLIPALGIGAGPALVALFLYSLLPIVRNTHTGITTIPPALAEAAEALGLSPRAKLFRVSLPMALPSILAGVKTSAVINVGTATLAALIGAGGLGDPILSGIQLRDTGLILAGALPAAALALLVQGAFDLVERAVVPRGLRLPAEPS